MGSFWGGFDDDDEDQEYQGLCEVDLIERAKTATYQRRGIHKRFPPIILRGVIRIEGVSYQACLFLADQDRVCDVEQFVETCVAGFDGLGLVPEGFVF